MTVSAVLAGGFLCTAEDTTAPKDTKPAPMEKTETVKKRGPADESLTPEQRAARRKEMAAKRAAKLKELKEKKTAGTLTDKEQKLLDRLEKGGSPGGAGAAGKHAKGDKPADTTK